MAAALMLSAGTATAQPLSISVRSRAVQQGDLLIVTVNAPESTTDIAVTAFGRTWPAYRLTASDWRALVGIDLEQRPGEYSVAAVATNPPLQQTRTITVARRQFTRRVLTVQPQYVNPPPEEMDRIATETAFLSALYAHSASEPLFDGGFDRPVPGQPNSSFGSRSVFNGQQRSPHAGTDFLSGTGTPIHAPAGGRVVAARDLFFTGNTVVVDHGMGVVSLLAHLSRIDVHEGQMVERGDIVGLVGATGRVTGPHLHWALRVGPARVDPLSALALLGATAPDTSREPK